VEVVDNEEERRIKVSNSQFYSDEYPLLPQWQSCVESGQLVDIGEILAEPAAPTETEVTVASESSSLIARVAGVVSVEEEQISIWYEEKEEREYSVPPSSHITVENDAWVRAGQQITGGQVDPQDLLRIMGKEAVQEYLLDEVQKVYRSQGVNINNKHIEVIVRQMLRKVRIDSPGDTELLPEELIDRFVYDDINAKVLAEGGDPATAQPVLLGITKASLNTDSFLSAASFQETTRVLTEAALAGKTDRLRGLKENVIIGKLIPAYCHLLPEAEAPLEVEALPEMLESLAIEAAQETDVVQQVPDSVSLEAETAQEIEVLPQTPESQAPEEAAQEAETLQQTPESTSAEGEATQEIETPESLAPEEAAQEAETLQQTPESTSAEGKTIQEIEILQQDSGLLDLD